MARSSCGYSKNHDGSRMVLLEVLIYPRKQIKFGAQMAIAQVMIDFQMRSVSKSICHTHNLFVLIRIELDVSVASNREPAWPIISTICSDLQQDYHDL